MLLPVKHHFGDITVLGFLTRFLPWRAGQERKTPWQVANRSLAVFGFSCLLLCAVILACLWLHQPQPVASPLTAANARLLGVRGTPRAEAEKILGTTGTVFGPCYDPDRVINWGDEHQLGTFPVPRFDDFQGADYAIQWGRPGGFIRLYFDENDRVVAIEGQTASDPPTWAERVQEWWRTVTRGLGAA